MSQHTHPERSYSARLAELDKAYRERPLTTVEADELRLLWLLAGIGRVKDHAGQFSGAELARELGLDGRQIGSRLSDLVRRGYIRGIGDRGMWTTMGCRG